MAAGRRRQITCGSGRKLHIHLEVLQDDVAAGSWVVVANAGENAHQTSPVAMVSVNLALGDGPAVDRQHGVYGLGEILDEAKVKVEQSAHR